MKLLLDENMSDRRLAGRLRAEARDPVLAADVGLLSTTEARLVLWAVRDRIHVLNHWR